MKRVAILGPTLESKGGVNKSIDVLKKIFERNNIEVHLFPIGKTNINIEDNRFIHSIDSNSRRRQFLLLKNEIAKYRFNLIIANNLRTHFLLSKLNYLNSLYIIHQGSLLREKNIFILLKQKIKFKKVYNGKRVIFLNSCFRDEFFKKFKNIQIEYKIIPNTFNFNELRDRAKEKYIDNRYIIGVGRLDRGKNFEYLIEAYAISGINEELWILGDGEEIEKLKYLTKKLKIENRVKFLGWRENPYPYIKHAKLLVHPSKFESYGNVLIEAFILNTPVVATDIKCGPSDILIDEFSEFLAPLNNKKILADKMELALKYYPEITDKFLEKYRSENIEKEYLEFIK